MLSRRKDPVETIVRKYGLRAPLDWGEDCEQELRGQVDLWNVCVGIEEDHRNKVRDLTADDATIQALQAEVDALGPQIESAILKVKANKKDADLKEELAQLKKERKAESEKLKDARRSARASKKDELDALKHDRHEAVKAAYQNSGLWWGNYNAVIASYERARARILAGGGELSRKWYNADGRITNQIQGGMSVADLFAGKHSQVRVAPLDATTPTIPSGRCNRKNCCLKDVDDPHAKRRCETAPTKSAGRKARYTTLTATVFVRDGVRRTVTWLMYMDRDIPDDTRIKEVVVTRRRAAHKFVWHVVFTCTKAAEDRPAPTGHTVAVDIGWRRMPDGLRVATVLRDEHGKPDFVVLPESLLQIDTETRELRSRRDDAANKMLAKLRALDGWDDAPEGLRERWNFLKGSPNAGPRALARFCLAWREDHKEWMPDVLAELDKWRSTDKRQWEAEDQHRQRLAGRRRMIFHVEARKIVNGAGRIIFDHLDLARSARKPEISAEGLPDLARRYRVIACVHELRHWVKVQAQRAGVPCKDYDGQSRACWHCGEVRPSGEGVTGGLIVTCRGCGLSYDQDVNDCRRMLSERSDGEEAPDSARTKKAA